jgi:rsbT co-antagonist protein RsbR
MTTLRTDGIQLSAFILHHRDEIAREWWQRVAKKSQGRLTAAETQNELMPMFDALVKGIDENDFDASGTGYEELRAMLTEYSRNRARNGFTPTETAIAIFVLRDCVFDAVAKNGEAAAEGFERFSPMIDEFGLLTFETYSATREAIIGNQSEQLLELSTPVVKLWDGVVAVPLVGTLDSARTQVVMEALLQTLVATESQHAIIDITGVPAVDTQVAQHLLKTVMAARLMGAECVISGIRPQIAQTIVALGVEFGDIVTKATLADALRLTLQRAGMELRKSERRA